MNKRPLHDSVLAVAVARKLTDCLPVGDAIPFFGKSEIQYWLEKRLGGLPIPERRELYRIVSLL